MKNSKNRISVVIPTYNMGKSIGDTIRSVFNQSYPAFEIIVQDNCSTDNTDRVVKEFSGKIIYHFRNNKNLGYAKNLAKGIINAKGDIIFLLGADDILSSDALLRTNEAFNQNQDIGVVTRPYYWFQNSIDIPIRVTPCLNKSKNEIVYINDIEKSIIVLHNEILGQLTGLAFRRRYLKSSYLTSTNDWIAHGYPFINIFKNHPAVFIKDFQAAIRIGGNTIRQKGSDLYKVSPTARWSQMLDELLSDDKYCIVKKMYLKKIIGKNFIGLIQIKCYSTFRHLIREIYYLLKINWFNIFDPKFWFYSVISIVVPSSALSWLVDYYKNIINSKVISGIDFDFDIS